MNIEKVCMMSIDFKDFMSTYTKCTEKPYSFLVMDTTPESDNPFRFRKNFLTKKLIK